MHPTSLSDDPLPLFPPDRMPSSHSSSTLREDTQDTLVDSIASSHSQKPWLAPSKSHSLPLKHPLPPSRRPWDTASTDARSIADPYDRPIQSQLVTNHAPFSSLRWKTPVMASCSRRLSRLNRKTAKYAKRRPFVVFLILSVALMTLAMTAYSTYNWAYGRMFGDVSSFIPPNATGIVLLASITSIDLDRLEASITWLPYGCGEAFASPLSAEYFSHFPLRDPGKGCGRLNRSVEIIVNDAEPFVYHPPTSPDYKYQDPSTKHGNGAPDHPGIRTWIPAFDTFNTTEQIVAQFALSSNWNAQAYYPFDAYSILMRVWAREIPSDSNTTTTPLSAASTSSPGSRANRAGDTGNGTSLPILKVFSVDSPTGYPVITGSWDVYGDRKNGESEVATEVFFRIQRHTVVKAFAIIVFLVNWGLMLVMVWILVLVFTDRSMTIPREILLLPITAILTIPQLRATMPGVPGSFGILIDIPGYFFTMTIIIICAVLIVLRMMYQAAHPLRLRRGSNRRRSQSRASEKEKSSEREEEGKDSSDSDNDEKNGDPERGGK